MSNQQSNQIKPLELLETPPTTHLVTIIIPVSNQGAATRQCIEAISANTDDTLYSGIIIDNASTEMDTITLLAALEGEVNIIRNRYNVGFFSACNQATTFATSKYLLFLHSDTIPQPGWLQSMTTYLETHPDTGAVSAKFIDADGQALPIGCSEACLLIQRELFIKMQGFNLNGEAIRQLCSTLRLMGYHIHYDTNALIMHGNDQVSSVPWEELLLPLPSGRDKLQGWAGDSAYPAALKEYLKNPVVLIELNSQCNFHCDYCRSPQSPRQKSFMKKELFIHIIKQIKEVTKQPLRLHVDGEPTLHPDFLELALMANEEGYLIGLATNGSALKPEFLQINMAIILNLSCSPEELKPRSGMSFDLYITRIKTYIEAWLKSESNQSIYLKIYVSTEERNTPSVVSQKRAFSHAFVDQLMFEGGQWKCDTDQAFEYGFLNKGGGYFSISMMPRTEGGCYPSTTPLPASLLPADHGFCDSAWKTLAILSDGTISFCCVDLFGETGFTQPDEIWEKPLKEIWLHHPTVEKIRGQLLGATVSLPICQKCLEIAPHQELYEWPEAFPFPLEEKPEP